MGVIGRQFGRPSGLLGALVGRIMARINRPFNEALVRKLADQVPTAGRIAEIGCGPGVGLAALLSCFPAAEIVGLDVSQRMLAQSRTRNRTEIDAGRLTLRSGGIAQLSGAYDLVVAVNVLYFWHDPTEALSQVKNSLAAGGVVAVGYRCRQDMPRPAQRDFPREGHRLYDDESEVRGVLSTAGFTDITSESIAGASDPLGWLTTGRVRH